MVFLGNCNVFLLSYFPFPTLGTGIEREDELPSSGSEDSCYMFGKVTVRYYYEKERTGVKRSEKGLL